MPSKVILTTSSFKNTLVNEDGIKTIVNNVYNPSNRSRTWSNTPNYQNILRIRSRGQLAVLPTNSLVEYNYFSDPTLGSVSFKNGPTRGGTIEGCWTFQHGLAVDLADPRFINLQNKALAKLPAKMNGSNFNVPLFLAEARKSVEMVRNAAKLLETAITDYKRLASLPKRERGNLLPWNKWLEGRYGWRLLMKDIYDGMCTIHDIRTFGIRQRVKATATETIKSTLYSSGQQWNLPFYNVFRYDGTVKRDTVLTLRVDVTLQYKEVNSALQTLQQLGITNPVNLVWELIPYSFVIDWFIPIGDYLSSFDRFLGKEFVSGSISKTIESDNRTGLTRLDSVVYPWYTFQVSGLTGVSRYRIRSHSRVALGSFPSSSLPRIDVNINASRAIDAISLLMQRRKTVSGFSGNPSRQPLG